jgi:hypothetical protein
MKFTARRIWFYGLLAIFLLPLSCLIGYHLKTRWAVERYERQLRSKGEKLELVEVLASLPHPDGNRANLFRQIATYLPGRSRMDSNFPTAMHMIAPGRAIATSLEPDIREEYTNSWEEALSVAATNRPHVLALRKFLTHPTIDFSLDYSQNYRLLLPHLSTLRGVAMNISLDTVCRLHAGETAEAVTNICVVLAIVQGFHEPLYISQMVRMSMLQFAMADTWEFLQIPNCPLADLEKLSQAWESVDVFGDLESVFNMVQAFSEEQTKSRRKSSDAFRQEMMGMGFGSGASSQSVGERAATAAGLKVVELYWRWIWGYPDQLRTLKGVQVALESARRVTVAKNKGPVLEFKNSELKKLGFQIFEESSSGWRSRRGAVLYGSDEILATQQLLDRAALTFSAREIVLTALALKKYQIRNQKYPSNLVELTPDFLPSVPLDPMDGKPLRYRLVSSNDFMLYSVGLDLTDNQGDPSTKVDIQRISWTRGADMVWPRLAPHNEIEGFYRKKASRYVPPPPKPGSSNDAFLRRYGISSPSALPPTAPGPSVPATETNGVPAATNAPP